MALKEDESIKARYSEATKRWFQELRAVHMEPNQACALALKIAAGMAEPPISVDSVMLSLHAATKASTVPSGAFMGAPQHYDIVTLQDAAAKVYRLFSSPDSLHAAFWRPYHTTTPPTLTLPKNSIEVATSTTSTTPTSPTTTTALAALTALTVAAERAAASAFAAAAAQQGGTVHGDGNGIDVPTGNVQGGVQGQGSGGHDAADAVQPQAAGGAGGGSAAGVGGGVSVQGVQGEGDVISNGMEGQEQGVGAVWGGQQGEIPAGAAGGGTGEKRRGGDDTGGGIQGMDGSAGGGEARQQAFASGDTTEEMEEQGVDLTAIMSFYSAVTGLRSQRVVTSLMSASERLVMTITSMPAAANPGLLRQLLILLLNPLLEDLEHTGVLTSLNTALVTITPEQKSGFVQLLAALPLGQMRRLVIVLQQYITITLYQQQAITPGVEVATKVLGLLHEANSLVFNRPAPLHTPGKRHLTPPKRQPLPYTEFYNDAVNNEDFNLKEDFRRWKSLYRTEFSFCAHPYVYDPASKARVLQMECQLAQYNELHTALFRGLFGSAGQSDLCPFLVLKVRRGPHMVQDTLIQVHSAKEQDTLRKPLKVKFVGEEGVDEGGVQKEFFQLLVRELFNPDYGMFVYDEAVRLHWFRPSHLDLDTEFELVGILIGLAIYNSHILEFSFPLVLYKLLVGCTPGLEDLRELHPEIHTSLSRLLTMSEEEVASCGLTFSVDVEYAFAQVETIELIPGQGGMEVTAANAHLYVEQYTQHLLQRSVQRQLASFRRGFLRLCAGAALEWFRPEELELLVCGGRSLDLSALEAVTLYDDGYCKESTVVRWFWEVAHTLDAQKQKRLLAFVTGSDRVPIKGLGALNPPFVISRMGGDPDRLPTAHTCFNHLLLPAYSSKDALRQRLLMALENAEGFGLM